jgi:hypothetical protein
VLLQGCIDQLVLILPKNYYSGFCYGRFIRIAKKMLLKSWTSNGMVPKKIGFYKTIRHQQNGAVFRCG